MQQTRPTSTKCVRLPCVRTNSWWSILRSTSVAEYNQRIFVIWEQECIARIDSSNALWSFSKWFPQENELIVDQYAFDNEHGNCLVAMEVWFWDSLNERKWRGDFTRLKFENKWHDDKYVEAGDIVNYVNTCIHVCYVMAMRRCEVQWNRILDEVSEMNLIIISTQVWQNVLIEDPWI